jgi:hypothetical protein
MAIDFKMDGPIPGENFTSDTRNYPWHRPPEYTTTDDALDWISKMLTKKEGSFFVVTMLKFGIPVRNIVSTILMKGISQGKWSIDLALLIAGPISHIVSLIAKKEDIEYDMGLDNGLRMPTDEFFSEVQKIRKNNSKPVIDIKQEIKTIKENAANQIEPTGFMGDINSTEEGMLANG